MPESNVGVARHYAEAAFQLAVESNTLDRWLGELRLTAEAMADSRVRRVLDSPAVSDAEKAAIVRRSLASVDPRLLNLVLLMIERRRLALIGVVASEFARLADERRGIVLAEVTTAVPLDEAHQAVVTQRLSTAFGKQVRLRTTVDPSIIGGLVVKVGDRLINGSVAGRLASLRRDMA